MNPEHLRAQIVLDEGHERFPYLDTRGIWTGGIGENLPAHGHTQAQIDKWRKTGIPDGIIEQWYAASVGQAIHTCRSVFASFDDLPENVQIALVDMAFNLAGKLYSWPRLIAAIASRDFYAASSSIMNSEFAKQCPNRCKRLAALMLTAEGKTS